MINNTPVVFLVGVAGAGKDTILKELLKTDDYKLVISHTTRSPRVNNGVLEQNGREYHFITEQEAMLMLENKEFIEAKVYSGNVYGTSLAEVQVAQNERKIAISDIEVQGIAEYMKISPKVIPIFILPPSFGIWQQRLKDRYKAGLNLEDIKNRMQAARTELEAALSNEYFQYVVNQDLPLAVKIVSEITQGHLSNVKNDQAKQVATEILERLKSSQKYS